MRLGDGFLVPAPPVIEEPRPPSLEDLRNEQLLVAIAALQDALLNMPRPEVHVEAPDLSAIVTAVTGLKPGATSEDIAEAVVRQISPATPQNDVTEVMSKVVKALEKLDFRMQASGGGGVAVASTDIKDRAERVLGRVEVTNFPASGAAGSSTTEITNDEGNPIPVSGTVTVSNPATSVSVSNFPATQPVSGTVTVANPTTSVSVSNFPASTEISNDSGNPIPVSGTVTVSNPTTSVSVSNFPATQPVSGTVSLDSASLAALEQTALTNSGGLNTAAVQPFGALDVNIGPGTLFYDSWSGGVLDTNDRWLVSNGNAPTLGNGNLTMSAAPSSYNVLRSRDTIKPNAGFANVRNGITLEATAATGAGRFWGLGLPATTPSATSLVQDGIGFEIDQTSGSLQAVTYANGVKTVVATLTRPTDGAVHAYGVYFRVTRAYWFVDDLQNHVATAAFPNVPTAELPAVLVRNNAASFTGTPTFVNIAHLTADTAKQGFTIADPVVGTRMARVADPTMYAAPPAVVGQGFGNALNVNPNAIQKRTYSATRVTADLGAPAALVIVANSRKSVLQLHHLAASTSTKRIRRISVGALAGAAVQYQYELYRVTSAPTGGTAVPVTACDPAEAASDIVATFNPTSGGTVVGGPVAQVSVLGATTGHPTVVLYDWEEGGMTKPPVIRAGQLEGWAVYVRGTGTAGPDPQITVEFTAE